MDWRSVASKLNKCQLLLAKLVLGATFLRPNFQAIP